MDTTRVLLDQAYCELAEKRREKIAGFFDGRAHHQVETCSEAARAGEFFLLEMKLCRCYSRETRQRQAELLEQVRTTRALHDLYESVHWPVSGVRHEEWLAGLYETEFWLDAEGSLGLLTRRVHALLLERVCSMESREVLLAGALRRQSLTESLEGTSAVFVEASRMMGILDSLLVLAWSVACSEEVFTTPSSKHLVVAPRAVCTMLMRHHIVSSAQEVLLDEKDTHAIHHTALALWEIRSKELLGQAENALLAARACTN